MGILDTPSSRAATDGSSSLGDHRGAAVRTKEHHYHRMPILSLCLVAAVVTSLGAIVHSGRFAGGLSATEQSGGFPFLGAVPTTRVLRTNSDGYDRVKTTVPRFQRTKYTFDSFVVAGGIDLAGFGLDDDHSDGNHHHTHQQAPQAPNESYSFELFEDFDLSPLVTGRETWVDLLAYRRDATHPSLSFYVDKVAYKRWLVHSYSELRIDLPKPYLLRYASELDREVKAVNRRRELGDSTTTTVATELLRWLPDDKGYAAKPTHLSCSGGVWLVHHSDVQRNQTFVGNGKKPMKPVAHSPSDLRTEIATDLASNLDRVQEKCGSTVLESYALRHVRPGIVVEERFAQPANHSDSDPEDASARLLRGGMEFKVFTVWGRAWLTVWRPGTDGVRALFFRNGTSLAFDPPAKKNKKKNEKKNTQKEESKPPEDEPPQPSSTTHHTAPPPVELPEWIDWDRVISMGEKLGQHKDMFRTDIFVGVVADDDDNETQPRTIRYVVSETEIHPTPLRGLEPVFDEAGRLWLAGYYLLGRPHGSSTLAVVPNTEVPRGFYPHDPRR